MKEDSTHARADDDELWNDIDSVISNGPIDTNNSISGSHSLSFGEGIASGFRFRYQSEIDKKSYSALKGEKNKAPTLKVSSPCAVTLQLDLVTANSTPDHVDLHFNTFYEVMGANQCSPLFDNGVCFIPLNGLCEIRLDFLGIRKWKLKEAITRIKEINPNLGDSEAKEFFYKHKNSVKVRALLVHAESVTATVFSNTIKSMTGNENKQIKIQHISPKIVADNGEMLIIVLEKKITTECTTRMVYDNFLNEILPPIYQDGQTFVYRIPPFTLQNPITAKVRIECSDSFDQKPIQLTSLPSEIRKRKSGHNDSEIPLKKPTNFDSPRQLYPESGVVDIDSNIEFDCAQSMDIEVPVGASAAAAVHRPTDGHVSGNDSCKDSGIHSDERLSNGSDIDSDDDGSYRDSDDDDGNGSDLVETEGNRSRRLRRRSNQFENLEPINFPPTKRTLDSRLHPSTKDIVANKIFSEVARIAHDYAFGKQPSDLFNRMEKQLPVVFTLQDDVGDTPLNNAILQGNEAHAEHILKVVKEECKWALDLANTSGHTAVILAPACNIPAPFITKLLDAGCRLDIWDDLGKSAITYAIEYKNVEALRVLLEHIRDRNMKQMLQRLEKVYYSPLQVAVMNNFVEAVAMFLALRDRNGNYMVDVNELALMNDDTALHIAVERQCKLEIIKLLVTRTDLKINHKKDNNATALHTAIRMKLHEVVSLLRQHQAEDSVVLFEVEEAAESDDEMDDDDDDDDNDDDAVEACVTCPVVEMACDSADTAAPAPELTPAPAPAPALMDDLIKQMESMNLKGEARSQLIDVLLLGDASLTVAELQLVIRPNFAQVLDKFLGAPDRKDEMKETLNRYNCLPNSLGQLFRKLRDIDRADMITRVVARFRD